MQIQLKTSTALTYPNGDSNLNNDGSEDDLPVPGQNLPKDDDKINVRDLQHGPYDQSKRQCKDIFWFLFYWLNTLAMIILSAWAYFTGAPSNIYRPTDSFDNVCGKRDTPVENYRYVYFYNLATYDTSKRVCLEYCPRLNNGGYNFQCYPNGPACVPNVSANQNGIANQTIQDNGDYFIAYQSAQKIDRICLPTHKALRNVLLPYGQILASGLIQSKLLDIVSDVQNDYGWLFIMGGIAIAISIMYWIGLRLMPVVSIWVSLIMTIVLFCLIAFVFLYNGGALTDTDVQGRLGIATGQDRAFYTIYGGFCMALTIITIIVFICCFHQLGPTIQMLKIANKFFAQIPTSLIIVGMMTAMMYLFWMTAISSMIYAVSASQYNPTGKVFTQVTGKSDRGIIMFYYFLFNGFWTHQIFMSTMVFAISNITAKWYFHTGPIQQLDRPMWRTLMMIMRYLFGSLAFGSLILLLVQFLEFFIQMIFFVHSWKYHDKNACFRAIDDCLQAFALLMSKATKRINRFAYIQIALRGKSFIQASKDGYRLLRVNEHRYRFLFTVDSILFFMIRLGVALIPTTIFYLFVSFASFTQTSIMQPIYFVLLIFYFSLGMASVIIGSYSACIDTLITCYVIDQLNQKEKNGKPLYAPVEMVQLFRFIR